MNWWHNRSIRFKAITGIGIILTPVLVVIIFGITRYAQGELWRREVLAAENLNAIASTLVSDAMMEGRKDKVHETLLHLGKNVDGQFDSIAIYDDQSVLTSYATGFPGGRTIDKEIYEVNTSDPTCWVCHQLPPGERPAMTIVSVDGQDVLRSVVPLYNEPRCQTCHGTGQEVLGDSIVDLRLERFQQTSQTVAFGLGGSILAAVAILVLVIYQFTRRTIISPLEKLVAASQEITQGVLDRRVEVQSEDEIGQLGKAFNEMATQVSGFVRTLEQRVAERTQSLELRSAYLQSSAEVSRKLTSILDKDDLIQQSVNLIRDQFNFYYVGLFLVDDDGEWAVLKAGTGQAGMNMLSNNHRIKIGEGMIGWCIANAQSRIALDVGDDAVRFDNPFLPDTRSEGALPLRSRGHVLGALTVQSDQPNAFDQDIINTLQTMVDQIAIILENADLFTSSEAAHLAERKAYGDLSAQEWRRLLQRQSVPKFVVSAGGNLKSIESSQTLESTITVPAEQTLQENEATVILPIKIRGNVLGGIKLRKSENEGKWTQDQLELINTISEQLGIALENARLLEEARRRAIREQIIGEISTSVSSSTDMAEILRSAVQELGSKLGGAEVTLELGTEQNGR